MNVTGSRAWRWLFMAGGLVYFAGSLQHPRGTMVEMLADPVWVRGHATIVVGIILMIAGLVTFRRSRSHSTQLGHWLRIAVIVSALEAVEMTIHTVANVDATALANGVSTPVLTTHLWLATLVYPLFGVVFACLIVAGLRNGELGSKWIAPIGLAGAVAHGVVMPLVLMFEIASATILFPIAALGISFWFVLAGLWFPRQAMRGTDLPFSQPAVLHGNSSDY